MIHIGAVNIDTSHPLAFCEYLEKGDRARYVAVYNDGFRGDDEVEAFIRRFGLEKRCQSVDELADMADIGFIQGCNWDQHLMHAMPFIERGKPVFIDKPLAGNIADCRKFEDLAAKGAVILGSSSLRYAAEIADFASKGEDEIGKILNVYGTVGVDEFNYAIHIVEGIGGLIGTGAVSSRYVGGTSVDGKVCETYFVRFENGVQATFNTFHGTWQPCDMVIMSTKGTYHFRIDTSKVYAVMLDRICHYMETGESTLAGITSMTESIRIMLAGRISRSNGGVEIRIDDIPDGDPGFDGYQFEKAYKAAATKMYL